ncbi:MAG: XRE family transcriptional regulator [Acidobacteriaceae bacterium]
MAHKWRDVRGRLSPEREERIRRRVEEETRKLSLHQLRQAREMTQMNMASVLHVNQGAVSKMEGRTDMYVSTLRSYIEAMGGHLQIRAVFPDGQVEITQFRAIEDDREAASA